MKKDKRTEFEKSGAEKETGLVGEFIGMLKENKKYWLIPLILILILILRHLVLILRHRSCGALQHQQYARQENSD